VLSSYKNLVKPPVKVKTRGGEILKVDFDPSNQSDVFLEGLTRIAFEGVLKEY
jgi:diaminopimelate epimerase